MSGNFAGSKSLDERRRRRLASEAGHDDVSREFEFTPPPPAFAHWDASNDDETPTAQFPLKKLISPRPWKHWAIGAVTATVAALLIWMVHAVDGTIANFGPGSARLFDPARGRALPIFGSIVLMISGQLALLVFWARSRSQQDFQGRYEIWAWAAAGCFVFAFGLATDAHLAWSETFAWLWKPMFWRKDVLCWLAPLLMFGSVVWKPVRAELRGCRTSAVLIRMAVLCWLVSAGLSLRVFAPTAFMAVPLLAISIVLAGNVLLLVGMLHQARHVIYVSPEPPPIAPTWLVRQMSRLAGAITRRESVEKPQEAHVDSEDRETVAEEAVADPQAPTRELVAEETESAPEEELSVDEEPEPSIEEDDPQEDVLEADAAAVRDHRIDPADLKGLSKRERRRLRKQQRDAERAARRS